MVRTVAVKVVVVGSLVTILMIENEMTVSVAKEVVVSIFVKVICVSSVEILTKVLIVLNVTVDS